MRFALTVLIWIVVVGGLTLYNRQRQAVEAGVVVQRPEIEMASEEYSLALTPTFSIQADPFALQLDDSLDSGLELRLNGELIEVPTEALKRGSPWLREKLGGLAAGENEIFIKASPPTDESHLDHGVRVQLIQSGVAIVDQTVWGQQGSLVSGTIHFDLEAAAKEHDH